VTSRIAGLKKGLISNTSESIPRHSNEGLAVVNSVGIASELYNRAACSMGFYQPDRLTGGAQVPLKTPFRTLFL
jgi:hypothetical protein